MGQTRQDSTGAITILGCIHRVAATTLDGTAVGAYPDGSLSLEIPLTAEMLTLAGFTTEDAGRVLMFQYHSDEDRWYQVSATQQLPSTRQDAILTLRLALSGPGDYALGISEKPQDVTSPQLQIITPGEGASVGVRPVIMALVSDNRNLDTAQTAILLDGQPLSDISVNTSSEGTALSVTPPAALSEGSHRVTLTVKDIAGNATTVERTFHVIRNGNGLPVRGMAIVSVPFQPVTGDITQLWQADGSQFAYWNGNAYQYYPGEGIPPAITPGQACWAKFVEIPVVETMGLYPDSTASYTIPLHTGWNLIANPYLDSLPWDINAIQVRKDGMVQPLSHSLAWVFDSIWGWQPNYADPFTGQYIFINDNQIIPGIESSFDAWKGYWIKANVDCDLILPPPSRSRTTQSPNEHAWSCCLKALSGGSQSEGIIGETGISRAFTVSPPPEAPGNANGEVRLRIINGGKPVAVDLRAGSATKSIWELVVTRASFTQGMTEDIILSWPDLTLLPKDVSLILVDLATGERRYMRTTVQYRIPGTRATSENRFQIIAERGLTNMLQIIGLHVNTSREEGHTIAFSLTRAARISIKIRTPSGRLVRAIEEAHARTAGENIVYWNGRDQQNRQLPRGRYFIEVHAIDEDHRQIRAITIMSLN